MVGLLSKHDLKELYQKMSQCNRSCSWVKYYDEEIDKVNQSVKKVQNLVEVLENKLNKKIAGLKESMGVGCVWAGVALWTRLRSC